MLNFLSCLRVQDSLNGLLTEAILTVDHIARCGDIALKIFGLIKGVMDGGLSKRGYKIFGPHRCILFG